MTKKYLLCGGVIILISAAGFFLFSNNFFDKGAEVGTAALVDDILIESQCKTDNMIFYYSDQCGWCQKVKEDGTIDKIKKLGVAVKEVNVRTGKIEHELKAVPTFVIDEKIYSGYKTFEELQELLDCSEKEIIKEEEKTSGPAFFGDKGQELFLADEKLEISAEELDDNSVHFYHAEISNGKTVYFFVVKDQNGVYRAAANACQVCFGDRKGFYQQGNFMVCRACKNKYPLEKIATEKGGCNPGPINPNLEVKDGKIIIGQSELEQVSEFF